MIKNINVEQFKNIELLEKNIGENLQAVEVAKSSKLCQEKQSP